MLPGSVRVSTASRQLNCSTQSNSVFGFRTPLFPIQKQPNALQPCPPEARCPLAAVPPDDPTNEPRKPCAAPTSTPTCRALTSLLLGRQHGDEPRPQADLPPVALASGAGHRLLLRAAAGPAHLRARWPLLLGGVEEGDLSHGIFGVGFYNTFSTWRCRYTTATSATSLNSFIPVVTSVLALAFFRAAPGAPEVIGG